MAIPNLPPSTSRPSSKLPFNKTQNNKKHQTINTDQFIHDIVSLQPAMRRMAEKMLHDDDLANDAVQEAFVRLWRKRWRLGLMEDPQGFAMRTLRNLCIDMLRRDKNRQKNTGAAAAEIYNHPYDDDPLEAEQRYRQVEQAITSLSPKQQQLIEMKYVKQMSIHEMAQQTGLSDTYITTLLSRAYAALRIEIAKHQAQ